MEKEDGGKEIIFDSESPLGSKIINLNSPIKTVSANINYIGGGFSKSCSNSETYNYNSCATGVSLPCINNPQDPSLAGLIATIKPIKVKPPTIGEVLRSCDILNVGIETLCPNTLEIDKWYYKTQDDVERYFEGHDGENPIVFKISEISTDPIDYINKPILLRAKFKYYPEDEVRSINVISCSPKLRENNYIQTTNTTCNNENDGTVTLNFEHNIDEVDGWEMRYFVFLGSPDSLSIDPMDSLMPRQVFDEIRFSPKGPGNPNGAGYLVPNGDGTFKGTYAKLQGIDPNSPPEKADGQEYFIIFQEVKYENGKVQVKSGEVIPKSFLISQPTQIILDTATPNFYADAACGKPAFFNLKNTASGGNNLILDGTYSYEYSLDNGLNWAVVTTPNDVLEIVPTANPQSVQLRGVYTAEGNRCFGEIYQYPVSATTAPIQFINPTTATTSTPEALDGSIRIELSGGIPPYTYSISRFNADANIFAPLSATPFAVKIPGGEGVSFNNLSTGVFHIEVIDANNCSQISTDLTISTDPIPVLGAMEVTQMECKSTFASINVPVSDFDTDYRYQWIGNGIASPIQNSNAPNIILDDISVSGTYILRVSAGKVSDSDFENDRNAISTLIQINEPTIVDIAHAIPHSTRCNDTNDGSILLTVSGGTSYEYTLELFPTESDWFPLTGSTITNLAPDSYRVTIRNQDHCESDTFHNIIVNRATPLKTTAIKTDVTINGGSQGNIALDITGGTPFNLPIDPYTVTWQKDNLPYTDSDPSTPYFIDGLTAGHYHITVTDANGCNNIVTIPIAQPEALVATIDQTVLLDCNGDDYAEITASVQGGLPPYTYNWYQIINHDNNALSEDTDIIGGLSNGTYFLRLMDSNNNLVSTPPLIITQPNSLTAIVENITDVSCIGEANGAISITVSGGTAPYSYLWSNGATTQNLMDAKAGDYTLEIMDANTCYIEVNATIDAPGDTIRIVDATIRNVSEYEGEDGSIALRISGGTAPYAIHWIRSLDNTSIGNKTTISSLSSGTYQVTITDASGCSTTKIYGITQPDIVQETIIPPTCWDSANGRITVLVNQGNGDFTFDWDTGENTNTITDLTIGRYTVTIDGFGDGPITRTYLVQAPPPLPIDLEEHGTICAGGDLILDASIKNTAATYAWTSDVGFTSNEPNILVKVGGNYTVTVTSPNGCSTTESIFVDKIDTQINAEFAMSSQIFVGEPFIAVDISFPLPESLEWILPDEATVIKQGQDEAELIFSEAGEYKIGMVTKIGDCRARQTKKILVVANDNSTMTSEDKVPRPQIQDFILHPNPTNGKFVANILLPKTGPIRIKVYNFANNALMAQEKANGNAFYSIPLDLSGRPAGIYAVVLETPFGNALRKIILH
ncbi:MAG TPA: T9SS type A sorting domain-containing protein [Arenibacter sp.]|nr:T9SS type A sorting domain-containing protein [Arenibacter sp.]